MQRAESFACAVALLFLSSAWALRAQTQTPAPVPPAPDTAAPTHPGTRRAHRQPCWQEAGIPQSALQQRKQIEESTRSQVQSVCHDASLTPEQRREKIRQLRQESRQQMQALISPEQQQALEACRAQRGGRHRMGGGTHGGMHAGGGPCGEMPPAKGAAPTQESEPEQP